MSHQRRRGVEITFYPSKTITDNRGNSQEVPDMDAVPVVVRAAITPERSSRAEVSGQMQINMIKAIIPPDIDGVDLWSVAQYDGKVWDIASPPAFHRGTRKTCHYTVELRQRPS